jgi:hypothetical protein
LFSFSGSTVLPPGDQLFKEFREVLMSFLSGILQIQPMFFFVRQSFLFWNQISYFKGHVYSSLIVEIKSKRCLFLKVFFLKFKLLWSKTQHTIQCSPLIILYFENRNDPL